MTEYAKEKSKILRQLKVKLTKTERKRLRKMENEIEIDNFARSLIFREDNLPIVKKVVWCGDCLAEYVKGA